MSDKKSQSVDSGVNLVGSYSALAGIYDELMSHIDYQLWVHFAIDLLTDYGLELHEERNEIPFLECACGTGTFAINLSLLGYEVSATDASEAMITIAKSKAIGLENPPKFRTLGFLELAESEKYRVAICLYDSVNYLLNEFDLQHFFEKVKRALLPGGYLLFDICTIKNSKTFFSDRSIIESGDGYWSERQMKYDHNTRIQENRFTIKVDDQPGKIFTEIHHQKIYSVREIRKLVGKVGFNLLEVTNGFDRKPPNRRSLRVHFLCKKR